MGSLFSKSKSKAKAAPNGDSQIVEKVLVDGVRVVDWNSIAIVSQIELMLHSIR